MPGLDPAGKNQHGKRAEHQAVNYLRNQYLYLAGVAIGGAPRHWREEESRYRLNSSHQAELKRRIRQLIDEPSAGNLIHPERH